MGQFHLRRQKGEDDYELINIGDHPDNRDFHNCDHPDNRDFHNCNDRNYFDFHNGDDSDHYEHI